MMSDPGQLNDGGMKQRTVVADPLVACSLVVFAKSEAGGEAQKTESIAG